jgi:hypothetical protein
VGSRWLFRAYDINATTIEFHEGANASIVVSPPLTVDPISDAVNNVRFAANGFAADFNNALITMRTRSFFKLQIPEAGRLTVIGHLMYDGESTITTIGTFTLPLLQGWARFKLTAQMRVRVRGANGNIIFTQNSPKALLFDQDVAGFSTTTRTDIVSAGLFEQFLTVAPPDVVLPEDTIWVRIQYTIQSFIADGAEFVAEFDPGGLNIPMVIVNY